MTPFRRVPTALVTSPKDAGSSWPAIAIGAFVAFGGILFGYDTGTISGILAMDYWRALFSTGYRDSSGHLDVSPSQSSAVVSILSAGTFFGALSSPLLGDHVGRRWGLIVSCWIFNLGVALQTAAEALPMFLAGRFFAGFGVGLISALSKSAVHCLPPHSNQQLQFPSTSPRQRPNGFVEPLLVPTSLLSPSGCS